ncbi:MAG: D-alanyl-D-alanine carboxypeptidase family protein [Clostridia bacterium]|nr:D-alanyl-D-alanine carboxypeptidase family protein [Clostridia bacterium]
MSSDESVARVDRLGNITAIAEGTCTVTVTSTDNKDVYSTVNVTVVPQPDLTYIDGILIVNKTYPLPNTYAPGWETEASGPLWEMISAAKAEGINLWMTSGYRSYYDQEYIYNGYVARDGQAEADTYSARPGHSEHQTGLAYDLNDLASNFGETAEGKWVAENCHKYGFIVRYPKEKEAITGYIYEPWHIRYLGVEKATEVYESGLCLEEFLGITSVYAE